MKGPIAPGHRAGPLTPLSEWIVGYARAFGAYLDTFDSASKVESFRTDSVFNWHEYMPPPSGYKTFNQFFARHAKPGMRPVAGIADDSVLVAPADSTFMGRWQVSEHSHVYMEDSQLSIKGMSWSTNSSRAAHTPIGSRAGSSPIRS